MERSGWGRAGERQKERGKVREEGKREE